MSSPSIKKVFNSTDSPVQYDDEGHSIAGHETAEVENRKEVQRLVREGILVEIKEPESDDDKGDDSKSSSKSSSTTGTSSKSDEKPSPSAAKGK